MKTYEMSPVSARPAWMLARQYGYRNSNEMAGRLPQNARVADFGAGRSLLGKVIANKRHDIEWVNVDMRFNNMNRARRLQRSGPDNLHHVAANVLDMPFQPGSFDRVYTSDMLLHILMGSQDEGRLALNAMASLLSNDGEMHLNGGGNWPIYGAMHISAARYRQHPDKSIDAAVEYLTLSPAEAKMQQITNVALHYSGYNFIQRLL